jgi:predicted RNA-binding Zn-ribbon protein involved in translation (DUF1610 family)
MSERFISLKCQSCGAKLDVYEDQDHFACGHCGTEIMVQRRGGTVALKAVTEAIKEVQVGTDRTAAELALARLDKELSQLRAEYTQAQKGLSDQPWSVAVLVLVLWVVLRPGSGGSPGFTIGAILLAAVAMGFALRRDSRNKQKRKRLLAEISSKIKAVEQEMDRNRKLLGG